MIYIQKHKIQWYGDIYQSAEAIYQIEKLRFHQKLGYHFITDDMVSELATMTSGKAVMFRAKDFMPPHSLSPLWDNQKKSIMKEILAAKHHQVPAYMVAVSHPGQFIEDTNNSYWGGRSSGLNTLGLLHAEVRDGQQRRVTVIGDSLTRMLLNSSDHVLHSPAPVGSAFLERGVYINSHPHE